MKEFQKDHGLQVDGMIGNQTISMLGAVSSTMEAPDYVKAAAINSAKKAEPGGLHPDTLIISDKEMEKVLKKVEAKAEQAGPNNYVKVEIVNNKPVIKGIASTSQPATKAAGTAPVATETGSSSSSVGDKTFGLAFDNAKDAVVNSVDEAYKKATEFHFEERDELNGQHPNYSEVMKRDSGWTLLDKSMSIYHDNGVGEPELKFVNPDGREAVYLAPI